MTDTRWEDRSRSIKAAKLARVLERLLDANPSITVADLEQTDETFRHRVAVLAGTRDPSQRSWAATLGLLTERQARAAS